MTLTPDPIAVGCLDERKIDRHWVIRCVYTASQLEKRRNVRITLSRGPLTDKFVANLALTTPFDPCGRVTLPQTTNENKVRSMVVLSIGDITISECRNHNDYSSVRAISLH